MRALEAFEQLQQAHAAHLRDALKPLDDAMDSLDFDRALAQCQALKNEVGQVNPGIAEVSSPLASLLDGSDKIPCILVVDDQPINIQALDRIFAPDHRVLMATSGATALALCQEDPPDLILLDVAIPDMDGHEVCSRLNADGATRNIPVIFATSHTDAAEETKGLELGEIEFIAKPVYPAALRARVKTPI